jgi:hypothetical protein
MFTIIEVSSCDDVLVVEKVRKLMLWKRGGGSAEDGGTARYVR